MNKYRKYSKSQKRWYKNIHNGTCVGKVTYSKEVAEVKAKSESERLGFPLVPYKCPICKHWHLTKKYKK